MVYAPGSHFINQNVRGMAVSVTTPGSLAKAVTMHQATKGTTAEDTEKPRSKTTAKHTGFGRIEHGGPTRWV